MTFSMAGLGRGCKLQVFAAVWAASNARATLGIHVDGDQLGRKVESQEKRHAAREV